MNHLIPEPLVNSLLNDQVILFLGSGASIGAASAAGPRPPTGNQLRDTLCDKFLGGSLKDRSLAEIADYVSNEYDLLTLQAYIRELFIDLQPAAFHSLIPLFPWHAIVTTNYDLIIEQTYSNSQKKVRDIETFVKNGDKIDVKLRKGHDKIAHIKLHGCIDHATDTSIPLILSTEQFSKFRTNRDRLFERLKDLARQCSIVFCGYSISDPNIREILFDLTDLGIERPRYYMVKPTIDGFEERYWSKHRITLISADFETFLTSLLSRTSELGRVTASLSLPGSTTLNGFYRTSAPAESQKLITFLKEDVTHVRIGMSVAGEGAKQFYSGYDRGWWPIEQQLDVYRDVLDSIAVDAILKPLDHKNTVDLFVIKGPAGNGKTVALKRIAWDAANDYEQLVLYLNDGGALNRDCIQEIYDLTGKRQVILVDHVALAVDEVAALLEFAKKRQIPLTLIATERDNEWNVRCEPLERYLNNEFAVAYLTGKEIKQLLQKLEQHRCLGELENKTPEFRYNAFAQRAQRQLLVALHEVTLGQPFEQIIKDEYDRVLPDKARYMYLDICTLNRLGVPVRAGLVARITGISFERFETEFFLPLEHLVKTYKHPYLSDHLYEARHPYVAELVFAQALKSAEDRFEQIVRLLRGLNIDYSSDNDAFYTLIKGRNIAEVFPSVELGRKLFEVAHEVAKQSAFVFHQEAVFEMAHKGGQLVRAQRAIDRASELAPWDKTIQHSVANLKRRSAVEARTPLERDKLRKDAMTMLSGMLEDDSDNPHGLYTYAQLIVDELYDLLDAGKEEPDTMVDRKIGEIVKQYERCSSISAQRFPENEQFLLLEERFLTLLKKNDKAEKALQRAYNSNPRNEFIASRLAARLLSSDRFADAKSVLVKSLEQNPGGRLLHLKMAMFLMKYGSGTEKRLIQDHLRKSFTDGDGNYNAQFWYAREVFLNGDFPTASRLFDQLSSAFMSSQMRNEVRGAVRAETGEPVRYRGEVATLEVGYGFLKSPSFPLDIFTQSKDSEAEHWTQVQRYGKVSFELAFTMRGPRAVRVSPIFF